jgi:hypothetical protein
MCPAEPAPLNPKHTTKKIYAPRAIHSATHQRVATFHDHAQTAFNLPRHE